MKGSNVIVQIREANELCGNPSTYAEVNIGDQHQVTKVRPKTNCPLWDEKFTFDVVNGKEIVIVNVCENEFNGGRIVGFSRFELQKLIAPDYFFDDWTLLKNSSDQIVGQIKASIQWITSKVEYFNNLINKVDAEKNEAQAELADKQSKLNNLYGIINIA